MLVERIYKHYEQEHREARSHLGASELGHECERKLWLGFRWFYTLEFEGRMLRLFETGTLAEQRFIENLRAIGVIVKPLDEDTGLQHSVSAYSNHFKGSLDAIAYNIDEDHPEKPYILEFKTHNDRSFVKLTKEKLELANPQHYAQLQVYMGLSNIHQALYLAVNKNTDELYEEIIYLNHEVFASLMDRAKRIIVADTAPPRINDNPAYFKCKMCPAYKACHGFTEAGMNCRTCRFSEPSKDGLWKCLKKGETLTVEQQKKGCHLHQQIGDSYE